MIILFGALSLLPLFASLWPDPPPATRAEALDTHIPKGYVLVPIEVQNFEALDSILGRYAFVDLFRSDGNKRTQGPIAQNVRLLRAPRNPSHFAVLLPEKDSAEILSYSGPYFVIVKRPGGGMEIVKPEVKKTRRKIIYGGIQ